MIKKFFLILCIVTGMTVPSRGQYILNGSATEESCDCFVLTTQQDNQSGSVWRDERIDLRKSFHLQFRVYLGCSERGADGIGFVLQQDKNSLGANGMGLGFRGIAPSLGVMIDTYKNDFDPPYDYISIQTNGDIEHKNDLLAPRPASTVKNNIKDCQWHTFTIEWEAASKKLIVYFDDQNRGTVTADLIRDVFGDDPFVYWGFTGSTGGANNLQKFCNVNEPAFKTRLPDSGSCIGEQISFENLSKSSLPIVSHHWDFGDGNRSSLSEPAHAYLSSGNYSVDYRFVTEDGCESKIMKTIVRVGDDPVLSMDIADTCAGAQPVIHAVTTTQNGEINAWLWKVNDVVFSEEALPDFSSLDPGDYRISTRAISEFGCKSAWVTSSLTLKKGPDISFMANQFCKSVPVNFFSSGLEGTEWKWLNGGREFSTEEHPAYTFDHTGTFDITLLARNAEGCIGSFTLPVTIEEAVAFAGEDTIVVEDNIFQLNASGGVSYNWSPPTGLSNPSISNPSANIRDDTRYTVRVVSARGCIDTASVLIKVFKGSAIYVPNVFTPNGDGLNETLTPFFTAIRNLEYFGVYDRWGNQVFYTNKMNEGWNPSIKNTSESGVYTWILKATDAIGKTYSLRGTVLLLK